MTNQEIIQGAAQIFRKCIAATWNDRFGEDDGTMNVTLVRLMNAVKWARNNNEESALKGVLTNVAATYGCNMDMHIIADNIIDTIF